MFITFEGLDSSGKTTQAKLLVDRLKSVGREVLFLREPGGTLISEKIRAVLLDARHDALHPRAELFLFSAARAQLMEEVIRPALRTGKSIVCDRFYDSTTAYQGYGRGLNLEDIVTLNRFATSDTAPDLTLLVDVDLDEVVKRRREIAVVDDRMESAGVEFFRRVREGYLAIAAAEPRRVVVISGMPSVEAIHDHIWKIVQQRFVNEGVNV